MHNPAFANEQQLADYVQQFLNKKGQKTQREVTCGDATFRADIVTRDAVIECKYTLDRAGLYQALGQGLTYAKRLRKNRVILIGLTPTSPEAKSLAERIAADLRTRRNPRVEVVFLDQDPKWKLAEYLKRRQAAANAVYAQPQAASFSPGRVIGSIALVLLVWLFLQQSGLINLFFKSNLSNTQEQTDENWN
jgi:hypothetical protein